MEQKKVKLSLIFSLIVFAIGVAIKSLANLFGGFGLPFLAVLVLFVMMLYWTIFSADTRKRIIDLTVLAGISLVFATILYCSWEWALEYSAGLVDFINVFSNVYSVFSLIFLVYGLFRTMTELNQKTFTWVEVILGNKSLRKGLRVAKTKTSRQPKEVMNGDLEQKPINQPKTLNSTSYSVSNNEEQQNVEGDKTEENFILKEKVEEILNEEESLEEEIFNKELENFGSEQNYTKVEEKVETIQEEVKIENPVENTAQPRVEINNENTFNNQSSTYQQSQPTNYNQQQNNQQPQQNTYNQPNNQNKSPFDNFYNNYNSNNRY